MIESPSPARRRAPSRAVLALVSGLVVLCGVLVGAAPAGAHATLVQTDPVNDDVLAEAPSEVALVFDEPMEITPDAIRVLGPAGDRVDTSATRLSGGGARLSVEVESGRRGTYTVAWRATSQDGHTLTGSFVYHVEIRTGAQEIDDGRPPSVIAAGGIGRWLGFAGIVTAIGAVVLALLADRVARDRLEVVAVVAAAVGAIGTAVLLVAETATGAGRSLLDALSLVPDIGLASRTGQLITWRIGLLAVATVVAAIPRLWAKATWLVLVPLGAAAIASSASGHPWTASARAVAVTADSLHLLAAGAWAGGTVALLVALPVSTDASRLVRRFSTMAAVTVAVVAVSGTVSALFQVPDLDALLSTIYGQLLLAKVALFALLVLIGWVNRSRIVPRLESLMRALVRNVRLEVAVIAVLLGVTAALVDQPPARVTVDRPVDETVVADGASMQITVEPARVGDNTLHIYFFDEQGLTPLPVDAVEVTAAVGDVPPRRIDVIPQGRAHVSAYGATLGAPGDWTIEVTAVSDGTTRTFAAVVPVR